LHSEHRLDVRSASAWRCDPARLQLARDSGREGASEAKMLRFSPTKVA
jgi:hypothetical protein